ncbi:type II toxin-antitoxin system Phd/YefM family antitoxin [Phragmitibacter flavus]|nr:hypothetical protein [Phragmitibacter flavus]
MTVLESTERQIAVSQFKAHCTEELRSVEEDGITLIITRHGKAIAQISPPSSKNIPTIAEWIGSGKKFTLASDEMVNSFDSPTWKPHDWEQKPAQTLDPMDN